MHGNEQRKIFDIIYGIWYMDKPCFSFSVVVKDIWVSKDLDIQHISSSILKYVCVEREEKFVFLFEDGRVGGGWLWCVLKFKILWIEKMRKRERERERLRRVKVKRILLLLFELCIAFRDSFVFKWFNLVAKSCDSQIVNDIYNCTSYLGFSFYRLLNIKQ